MADANDFLMGGGGASAKFDAIGDTITGTIVSTEVRQQTDIGDGKPLVWDDGSPRMQLVVTLATDARDDTDDDGRRNLYVKGSKAPGSQSMHDAVRAAVQAAGAKGLEPGGTLTVTYVGDEPSKTRGFSPRKRYQATYAKPDHAASTGDFLGTVGGQPSSPVAPPVSAPSLAPASAPAPAPVQEESAADKARKLIGMGLADEEVASYTGLEPAVVAMLRRKVA